MNQIKRYGFSAIFFAAGLLLASSAWADHTAEHQGAVASETTIGGKVGTIDKADQSFQLKGTPKSGPAGSAEVNVNSKTNYVGLDGLADLDKGDKVEVDSDKSVSGKVTADTVTKI